MFLEKFYAPGLAHLSYMIGDGNSAAVIDPRRDSEVYEDCAARHGASITHIFETHRNEDYVIGSVELAHRTGARIFHGRAFDFKYGEPVAEGDAFRLGGVELKVLETPGHTFESISLAVYDPAFGREAVGVFTGDALFVGDVGRTDFFPGRDEEVAGLLYNSLFDKLLPLGDQAMIFPAHGAGSVCGSGMANRDFSTIGYERLNNTALQNKDRDAFIRMKVNEKHYLPPYFKKMEEYNQNGNAPHLIRPPVPKAMDADEFESAMDGVMTVLDVRTEEAFSGAYVPDSLAMPLEMIPAYAGWFLSYERPIGLIAQTPDEIATAVKYLIRIGYDHVAGYLAGGLTAWEISGRPYGHIPSVHARELVRRIEDKEIFTLLDVRKEEEVLIGHLPGAQHIFLGHLPERVDEIPRDRPVTTFCGSGTRAIIAASILKRHGFISVENSLGSMEACEAVGCPIIKE
jgi:hydroxyacylglutathione hydrolase